MDIKTRWCSRRYSTMTDVAGIKPMTDSVWIGAEFYRRFHSTEYQFGADLTFWRLTEYTDVPETRWSGTFYNVN